MMYHENLDKENYTRKKLCSITGKEYEVSMTSTQYHNWKKNSKHIQDVVPDYTPTQREFLITGLTPAEQDIIFKEEE